MGKRIDKVSHRSLLFFALVSVWSGVASGQNTNWTGAVDTNFFNDANWDAGAPNTANEYGFIDSNDANQVAIIDAGTGSVTLDGVSVGDFEGGNVIQNGGTLNFVAVDETKIGGDGALPSNYTMNNDAQLLYDLPLGGAGAGYGGSSFDIDFDVGNGTSVATLTLNDSAILRISDDMKISDNGTPVSGNVVLNDSSQITVGSGTSVGPDGPAALTISGNATYISGNSAGAGNTAQGWTNEGYLTLGDADVTVSDSGKLWIRTLQHRSGTANIIVENNARFDIFDVFFNATPDLGNATVAGDAFTNERTSELAEQAGDVANVTIRDSAIVTVDSNVGNSLWTGLALSGGTNRGDAGTGGQSLVDVQDSGSFTVQQDLNMTLGGDLDAKSTLKVQGPNATVAINGDLRFALDPDGFQNPGTATVHAVITGALHSTIDVGGNANIDNADLVIELDGFSPNGGESYELINAGSVTGSAFENGFDAALAELADGLFWEVVVNGGSVLLNVGGTRELVGDFNGDQVVNGLDFMAWQRGESPDGATAGDLAKWAGDYGAGVAAAAAAGAVPEPASCLLLLIGACVAATSTRSRR